ncbi:hypothetical protein ACFU1R_06770 [Priestia megaterium]|uniref:hypothetical protein n=1 Tax=Priestia megaterium TaxID=1404 RepID=UPI00366C99C2
MSNFVIKYNPETMLITEVIQDTLVEGDNPFYLYSYEYLQYENIPHVYLTDSDYSYLKPGDALTPDLLSNDKKLAYSYEGERIARFQRSRIAMMHYGATKNMVGSFKDFYMDAYYFNTIEEETLQDAVESGLITSTDKDLIINNQFGRRTIVPYNGTPLF